MIKWNRIKCLSVIEVSTYLLKLAEIAFNNFANNGFYTQSLGSFMNDNEDNSISKKNLEKMRRTASANM